jgi:hypothetical protein
MWGGIERLVSYTGYEVYTSVGRFLVFARTIRSRSRFFLGGGGLKPKYPKVPLGLGLWNIFKT